MTAEGPDQLRLWLWVVRTQRWQQEGSREATVGGEGGWRVSLELELRTNDGGERGEEEWP